MNPYYETDYGKLYNGHVLETLKALPSDTISCCITSPPYWALRDYGTDGVVWDGDADCEHEWGTELPYIKYDKRTPEEKRKNGCTVGSNISTENFAQGNMGNFCNKCGAWKGQLGLEPDFNLYIKHLCDIFDEVKRVLRKDGTCWVNLGDTYFGGGRGSDAKLRGSNKGNPTYEAMESAKPNWSNMDFQNKSLCNIPSRFSIEMQNRGWILRNKIIWHKPNCMPSSVTDRFTVDFEEIFFFVKNKKYWFEQQFEPHTRLWDESNGGNLKESSTWAKDAKALQKGQHKGKYPLPNANGRNMRTVWKIPTQPFPDAHFAVFPEKLVETPIKAGCPKEICTKCGKAREKVMEYTGRDLPKGGGSCIKYGLEESGLNLSPTSSLLTKTVKEKVEIGYTKCDCDAPFVAGVVLDPFMGSGTTAVYCEKNHYRWLGCEVSDKYCEMIKGRLEPYKKQTRLI